jgi:hypothetical protein
MKVRMMITIEVDTEEYPMPLDENVAAELECTFTEMIYDINGLNIVGFKSTQTGN